jgi:hypothetical protein
MLTFTVRRFRRVTAEEVAEFEVTASNVEAARATAAETDDTDLEWTAIDRTVGSRSEDLLPITPIKDQGHE